MAELNAKKIGFLKSVETNYLDRQKMDLIESIKVKTNEHDERLLDRQTIHNKGKLYVDVVPVVLLHQ